MTYSNSRSAFFLFGSEKRPKLKQQNPGATVGEIAKQLGAAWKVMSVEQKAPYEKEAKVAREKYDIEMARYRSGKFKPAKAAVAAAAEDEEDYSDED